MALTKEQTRELRKLIERRHEALIAEIRDDVDRVRKDDNEQPSGASPDPADKSVSTLIADLAHAEIEFARLRANPGAERCIDCQRLHEKTYAGPSGPTL